MLRAHHAAPWGLSAAAHTGSQCQPAEQPGSLHLLPVQDEHYARDEQYLYIMEKTRKDRKAVQGMDNLLWANLIHPQLLSP